MAYQEEGIIFQRQKEWLNTVAGIECGNRPPALSLNNEKLADVLISQYDYLDSCISNETFDSVLNSTLVLLLKFILENGPYLDSDMNFKEQIDMFFTLFRNLLRNHLRSLPASINLLILRLIENRACRWNIKSSIEEYYMRKIDQANRRSSQQAQQQQQVSANMTGATEQQYCLTMEQQPEKESNTFPSSGLRISKSYGDLMSNFKNEDAMFGRLKKLSSKLSMKDEVIIRNADSGKVMGIKGRRVHMIEEMSETVISFQKVAPTARDRVVQIAGQTVENINLAKSLIDSTITQNVSPIPFNEVGDPVDANCYYPTGDPYRRADYGHNANYTPQTSSESEGGRYGYSIKLQTAGKEANIVVSDKAVGEKLEAFLKMHNFGDYIMTTLRGEEKPRLSPIRLGETPAPRLSRAYPTANNRNASNQTPYHQFMPPTAAKVTAELAACQIGPSKNQQQQQQPSPAPKQQSPKAPHITYDREFLLSLSGMSGLSNMSRIIRDIQINQLAFNDNIFRC